MDEPSNLVDTDAQGIELAFNASMPARTASCTGTALHAPNRVNQPSQMTAGELALDAPDNVLSPATYTIKTRSFTQT